MSSSNLPVRTDYHPTRRSRNPLWAVYEYWAMAIGLGLFALLCMGSVPIFAALYFLLPKERQRPVVRRLISRAFRIYLLVLRGICSTRCDSGQLAALKDDGPLIVVANHPSLLDVVILIAQLPNATCIMKSAVLRNPLFIVAARMAGYISNGNAQEMFARSRDELAAGSHFIFFPEGGRSRQFPISSFSSACILLAKLTKTPLQTVVLEYSSPYLGKHWGLFSRPALPLRIRARLGERLSPGDLHADARGNLESYFRTNVRLDWP
jgi:1-acyl-sn-glycerol-3-phosphate acyltransferase